MGKKLFPEEIIDNSSEANFSKHSVQTKLIYVTVLLALVAIFVALPLIHVTVSVKSQGIIKPMTNRNQLVSLVSGNIEELYIEENASVVRGQTVAKIAAPVLQEQSKFNMQRQQKVNQYLSDLSLLLNIDESQVIDSYNLNESDASNDRNAASTVPSPPLQYKDRILDTMQNIEDARQGNIPNSAFSNSSNGSNNVALQNARIGLWKLLHVDTSSLLEPDQKNNTIYQQALVQFKQQINAPLQEIKEAQEERDRRQLLNERGIISDTNFIQSQDNLQTAWNDLLSVLNQNALTALEVPTPKEENTGSTNNNINPKESEELNLITPKYSSSLLEFRQQVRNNIQEIKRARQRYNRDKKLYERNVISEEAFEKSRFSLETAHNDFQLLLDQQRNKWQADRVAYQDELEQLSSDRQQIGEEQDQHIIRAPISGTIQNMKGIYEGSPVSANQALAEISPDTSLIAECYVPPKDIGLLQEGMEARFQISAYDYNQWGLLTGTIQEISNDVIVMNDQPVFKVRVSLDQTWLELQNGYRGNLKKGMSLLARFKVTERSLFQLLYDNLDDWLNPMWDDPGEESQQASM